MSTQVQAAKNVETHGHIGGRIRRRAAGPAVIDLERLGERTIWVDCDVLQADGGTRTASITGAFVAVMDAVALLKRTGTMPKLPVTLSNAPVFTLRP